MKLSLLQSKTSDLEKIIVELNRGREFTCRLREIIKKHVDHVDDEDAYTLVGKIMSSFCATLSILSSNEDSSSSSCKISSLKDRRGRYKRRCLSLFRYHKRWKKRTLETSVKETSTLVYDGHAWRKYGQKKILNDKYPRNYFRCTHKFDQDCQANKQVQRIQENPPLFRITYYGHHTCKTCPKVSQMICDSPNDHEDSNSVLLNFNSTNNNYNNHHHFLGMMVETVDLSCEF